MSAERLTDSTAAVPAALPHATQPSNTKLEKMRMGLAISKPTSPATRAGVQTAPLAVTTSSAPSLVHAMSAAQPYSDFDPSVFKIREDRLVQRIVEFMESPKQNPKRGSMPSERVQNCIKQKYPDLYASVVGSEYANQWHKFLKAHPAEFELLFPLNDGRNLPRIRLQIHKEFSEDADAAEAQERQSKERTLIRCLQYMLEKHEDDMRVEDFMKDYEKITEEQIQSIDPELPRGEKPPLPRFRDVVRLVKRNPSLFSYDPEVASGPRIRSADTWSAPPASAAKPARKRIEQSAPTFSRYASAPVRTYYPSSPTSAPARSLSANWAGPGVALSAPMGWPEAEVADSDPELFPQREAKLKQYIMNFLDSPATNPHKGSLPSERVQNCIKAQHPDLYKSVVGAGYANQWHRFIQCHADVFTLFFVEDNKRSVWRIRLTTHKDWEAADKKEREERQAKENSFLLALQQYLEAIPEKLCRVDDFIEAYKFPENETSPLPPRGDFVRFVRRHAETFSYDDKQYIITLKTGETTEQEHVATDVDARA